jgi:hypothetical protein
MNQKFKLSVPVDASTVGDLGSAPKVKVVAFGANGQVREDTVKLSPQGKGTATFAFEEPPGSVRLVLGPEQATNEELKGLQTISTSISSRAWQGKAELELQPITISSYYWWWWISWCREFTIRGRVLCPDGSPVPGAKVCAFDVDWFWWWLSEDQVGCATTDASGSFAIKFRWCCGWLPWWWWARRHWRLEPRLASPILAALQRDPKIAKLPPPLPQPDPAVFDALLDPGRNALRALEPGTLDSLRQRLLERVPQAVELAPLRIWPWWPWRPWLDCAPDIIFKVTQDCHGQERTIVSETVTDTRWDIPTALNVTLTANDSACCLHICHDPKDCPEGDCLVITNVCDDLVASIGGNPGAPPGPAGYLNAGSPTTSGDRPYGGTIPLRGVFGGASHVDYYELEWSNNGGATWHAMLPAAAGGFTRNFWGPALPAGPVNWHSVPFSFTSISGRNVIESRQHFEATNGPGTWGSSRFWDAFSQDLLLDWLTDGTFPDGTYQLRVLGWQLVGGNLQNPTVLPLCDTEKKNGVVITIDNRFVGVGPFDAHGHPCGTGTVHTCTTEPDSAIVAVRINGNPVGACATFNAKDGGTLAIDFMAHDPDGHLGLYSLHANYGNNLSIDLLSLPGATLGAGPAVGGVPSAGALVGPDYGSALAQGAASPHWKGGVVTLTIPNLHHAFPETCCYQLQLYVHKRTVVSCDHSFWGHANLSELSFTVIV